MVFKSDNESILDIVNNSAFHNRVILCIARSQVLYTA